MLLLLVAIGSYGQYPLTSVQPTGTTVRTRRTRHPATIRFWPRKIASDRIPDLCCNECATKVGLETDNCSLNQISTANKLDAGNHRPASLSCGMMVGGLVDVKLGGVEVTSYPRLVRVSAKYPTCNLEGSEGRVCTFPLMVNCSLPLIALRPTKRQIGNVDVAQSACCRWE